METNVGHKKQTKGISFQKKEPDLIEKIKELETECFFMIKYISNKRHSDKHKLSEKDLIDRYSKLSVVINKMDKKGNLEMSDDELEKIYGSILKVHNELSCETLPATPVSIKYTEFSKGGFLKRNKTINLIIILTIFFFLAFLALNILSLSDELKIWNFDKQVSKNICNLLLILAGSALGSGFYTLTTVRKYLVNRTYSPRYNPTYIIRYILGITSGSILVLLFENDLSKFNYSTGAIAIVGGFAADIVAIILSGIAESLKRALINSNNKEPETEEEKDEEKKASSF